MRFSGRLTLVLVALGAAIAGCSSDGDPQAGATSTTSPSGVETTSTTAPDRLPPPGRPLRVVRTIELPDPPSKEPVDARRSGYVPVGEHHVLIDGVELVDVSDPTAPVRTVAAPPGLDPEERLGITSFDGTAVLAFADCPGTEVDHPERMEHNDDDRRWCSEVVSAVRLLELDVDAAAWVPMAELTADDDAEYLGSDLLPIVSLRTLSAERLVVMVVPSDEHPKHWYEVDRDDGSVSPLYTDGVESLRCEAPDGRVLLDETHPPDEGRPPSLAVAPVLGAPPEAYDPEASDAIVTCDADHIEVWSPTVWRVRDQAGTLIRTWALPAGIVPPERDRDGGMSLLRSIHLDPTSMDRSPDPHRGMVVHWTVIPGRPEPASIHVRVFDGWRSEPLAIDPPPSGCCPSVEARRLPDGTIVVLITNDGSRSDAASGAAGTRTRTLHVIEPVDDAAAPVTAPATTAP